MAKVRIYRPTKSAMQSGWANTRQWVLEYEPGREWHDPLMGWVSSADTNRQVRLSFATEAEAIQYAGKRGLDYTLAEPNARTIRPKSYADNFKYNRVL